MGCCDLAGLLRTGSNPAAVVDKIWADGDRVEGRGGAGRGEEEGQGKSYIPQAQEKWLETIGN